MTTAPARRPSPPRPRRPYPVIDSWILPGLLLGVGFGVGGLAVTCGAMIALPLTPSARRYLAVLSWG